MKIDIFNINDFIKANNCKEVTNPVFFNTDGTPTEDGLFSNEIFGMTEKDRRNIFGYIDLHEHYIHPLIYAMFPRMGSIRELAEGKKYAIIVNKKIQVVPADFENAETGIDFFYNHFEDIKWAEELGESDSIDKKTRYMFLKSISKEEFFVDKWLVLPAGYRSESSTNRSLGDTINKLYKDLILKSRSMNLGFSFSLFGAETKLKVQNLLKQIYQATLSPASGKHIQSDGSLKGTPKNSMIRKHILGKNIDFSASNVITSPQVSLARVSSETPVPFGYGRFPLTTLLAMFQPFFVNYATDYLERLLRASVYNLNDIKKIDYSQFSINEVEKMIKLYIKSETERLSPIYATYISNSGEEKYLSFLIFEFNKEDDFKQRKNYIARPLTYMDLFYMVGTECLKDKHAYVTRYPVTNNQNIYPTKIKIATTKKTSKKWISVPGVDNFISESGFEDYPTIPKPDEPITSDNRSIDVMNVGNLVLASLNGDYDGDMVYMRGVFSIEANEEAERLIYSKTNLFGADGKPSRGVSKLKKESLIALYELTKEKD